MQKIPVENLFNTVLDHAARTPEFEPTPQERSLMKRGFVGIFNEAQTKFRKNPLPWKGFRTRETGFNAELAEHCLKSSFCKMFLYHLGTKGAYLGTIMNASQELASLGQAMGLAPYLDIKYWMLPDGPEKNTARDQYRANEAAGHRFANLCDTFCQVMVYLVTEGKTSSVAGDVWRKAVCGL
jgi:hypothetical protein